MIRGVGAALAVAVVALSGCASSNGEEPPVAQAPDAPVNPWDLPLEERPDLFDPCAEIPIEAIEEGVGSPVEPDELLRNYEPDELRSCGWRNDEVLLAIAATWRSRQGFLTSTEFGPIDTESGLHGRPSFRMSDRGDEFDSTCYQVVFSPRGAVVVHTNLLKTMGQFRGENFKNSCDVLEEVTEPVIAHIPGGDFE